MSSQPYSVSGLTALVRDALAARPELEDVLVEGEISNVSFPVSGHLYFSLKDAHAGLSCVAWRSSAQRIPFQPENGMTVIAHGSVALYEQQGRYQLIVDRLEPSGVGALALAVEQLKRRLAAEGLFDERAKRPLPLLPRRVVVVTSRSGAAFRDVCTVAARRAPGVNIVLSPATVQGEGAADTVVRALRRAAQVRGADVVLLVRGGGSIEDLMAFNSEGVARAVRASPLPVVSGIGHETDVTVADLAADHRAATPSAAAELVVPSVSRLRGDVARRALGLRHAALTANGQARERLEALTRRLEVSSPARRLAGHRQELDSRRGQLRSALLHEVSVKRRRLDAASGRLQGEAPRSRLNAARDRVARSQERLGGAAQRTLLMRRAALDRRTGRLDALSPLRTLERGYSITLLSDGGLVTDAAAAPVGAIVRTVLHRGRLESVVTAAGANVRANSGERMYDTGDGGSQP